MSWFSWLTGNSKATETAVEGVSDLLDNAFYTEEERGQVALKMLEFRIDFAKATQHMSISRRVITFVVTAMWALTVLLLMALGIIFGKEAASVKFVFDTMKDIVNPPFMIIVGFYFLSQVVSKARGKP